MCPDKTNPAPPPIPEEMIDKWQRITDLMAKILEVPAALVMRFDADEIEVFVSSKTQNNPYTPGERIKLPSGLYCEWVRDHKEKLYIADATKDPRWKDNPDVPLGMIAYIGFPLLWPDGEVFGTICALDRGENENLLLYQDLLNEFREVIDDDLRFAVVRAESEQANQSLAHALARLQIQNEELLSANRTIEEMVVGLQRSNQELEDFAHIVAHDIKEPLRGIHQYADILLEDYASKLDEDGIKKLSTLPRLTDRLTLFVESLLHYSRVGRTELGIKKTNFNVLIEDLLDSLQATLYENGVDVRVQSPLPTLHCDELRIGEVFRNLIVNAIKYNDKRQKWIEIGYLPSTQDEHSGKIPPGDRVFYVRDNGMGIPKKHLETIFQIFKQVHGRSKGGVGAGLTIARRIVERHGGRIWAKSKKGKGTTFYFSIPPLTKAGQKKATRQPADADSPTPKQPQTIRG